MHNAWANLRASAFVLASFASFAWTVACASSLDPDLEGRSCSADGQCVDGYVCSNRVCISLDTARRIAADGGGGRAGSSLAAAAGSVAARMDGARVVSGAAGSAPQNAAGAASKPSSATAGAPASAPVAGAMNASDAAGAGGAASPQAATPAPEAGSSAPAAGAPAPAPTPNPPAPAAGRGGMSMPMTMQCNGALDWCDGACVDLQHNRQHCGRCEKHCNDKSACIDGRCEKAADAPVASNDVAGLARILALFGFGLADLADVLGVEVDDLATTPITLSDLALLGIDEVTLGLLGLGIGTLALLGIELSFD